MEGFHALGLEVGAVLIIYFKVKGFAGDQSKHQITVIDTTTAKHVLDTDGSQPLQNVSYEAFIFFAYRHLS